MEARNSAGRERRRAIAAETLQILSEGEYRNANGVKVSIRQAQEQAVAGTVDYPPEKFPELLKHRDLLLAQRSRFKTEFRVIDGTTFAAARELVANHSPQVLCLNFASAKSPGGGFINGAQAQEECLARASGLYGCLAPCCQFYDRNSAARSSLYTDGMIYSPAVPVFRDDRDQLLDATYCVSIVTSPAVNLGALRTNEPAKVSSASAVMYSRLEKILTLGFIHHAPALVLGAWGCGVFQNDPEDIARMAHHFLAEGRLFDGVFQQVVFAVLDNTPAKSTIRPFSRVFSGNRTLR